jgi:hypothetical protein
MRTPKGLPKKQRLSGVTTAPLESRSNFNQILVHCILSCKMNAQNLPQKKRIVRLAAADRSEFQEWSRRKTPTRKIKKRKKSLNRIARKSSGRSGKSDVRARVASRARVQFILPNRVEKGRASGETLDGAPVIEKKGEKAPSWAANCPAGRAAAMLLSRPAPHGSEGSRFQLL